MKPTRPKPIGFAVPYRRPRVVAAVLAVVVALGLATLAPAQPLWPDRTGPVAGGGYVLSTGWTIEPAGESTVLDTFPLRGLLSPDGKYLVVMHAGLATPSLWVFETAGMRRVDVEPLADAWFGMAFAPGGRTLYVSGGATAEVYEYAFAEDGQIEKQRSFSTVPRDAAQSGDDFIGDVAISPDGRLIYVAALFRNEVLVINPQSGWVIERFQSPRRPYRILPASDGRSFYMTSWAEGSLHKMDAAGGGQIAMFRLGLHPMDIARQDRPVALEEEEQPPSWKQRLFVASANSNRVHVIGISESGDMEPLEPIRVSMWPYQPLGMTPSALAVNRDQSRLYVVCSDGNAVAVVDISRPKTRVLGFVATGWYPTDAAPLPDGRLAVLNGKGSGVPEPAKEPNQTRQGVGTMNLIPPSDEASLFQYTKQALRLSPYTDQRMIGFREIPGGNPIPPGANVPDELRSPIRHVLYIVLGNRGDGSGTDAPSKVTPNYGKLAQGFVRFGNFHAIGAGHADGAFWATAAIAPAYIQHLWPSAAAGRLKRTDFGSYELAAAPPTGFLWTQATLAGLSVRNYGVAVENHSAPAAGGTHVKRVVDPGLEKFTNLRFRGPDPGYPDSERAKVFVEDLKRMDEEGDLPRLVVMRLAALRSGNAEASTGTDAALGMIVEACTRSKFWPQMAILVAEEAAAGNEPGDDPSLALAISPYVRRGAEDGTFYNSASVLRTIELILGLNPMTQFDAAAMPMWAAFQPAPDLKPYDAAR